MHLQSKKETETNLRKMLEYFYDHGRIKEAIILGDLLDKEQCTLFQKDIKEVHLTKTYLRSFA